MSFHLIASAYLIVLTYLDTHMRHIHTVLHMIYRGVYITYLYVKYICNIYMSGIQYSACNNQTSENFC